MKKIHKNGQEANQLITDMVKRFAVSTGKSLVDNCNNFSLPTGLRVELDDALDQLEENYIGLQDEHEPVYNAFSESIKSTGKIVSTPLKIGKKKQKTIAVLSTGEFLLRQNLILEERRPSKLNHAPELFLPDDYDSDTYSFEVPKVERDHFAKLGRDDFVNFAEKIGLDYTDDNEALDAIQIMETFFNEYDRQVEEKKDEEFLEIIRDPGLDEMPELSDKDNAKLDYLIDKSFDEAKKITLTNNIPKGDTMNEERGTNDVIMPDVPKQKQTIETVIE
ncbi:hypothetical protein GOV10_05365, partial [Candidatus Woesearchaeota archaeon]|nr:hypothetical protein [Candidatus Woesearchaeota archaeon]